MGRNCEYQREYASGILQPFFISPGINISDIYVSLMTQLKTTPELKELLKSKDLQQIQNIILEVIYMKHPFPVLERETDKTIGPFPKGSHVYVLCLGDYRAHVKYDHNR